MPALQTFCIQAAVAILFNYLFQITAFVVAFATDSERRMAGKTDVFCCIQGGTDPQPKNLWKKAFGGPYYRVLKSNICFAITIVIALVLMTGGVIGATQVPVGLNEHVSMEVGSELYNYFTYEKKYIEVGPPAYLVFNNFDFQNKSHINIIKALNN